MSKSGARILVVDDEIEILRALQRSLTAHGYEVFTAGSGEEALEAIARHRPDLMLLDLGLPGMSGLEVCKRVRAESNLPIIVLSVKDAERDKVGERLKQGLVIAGMFAEMRQDQAEIALRAAECIQSDREQEQEHDSSGHRISIRSHSE